MGRASKKEPLKHLAKPKEPRLLPGVALEEGESLPSIPAGTVVKAATQEARVVSLLYRICYRYLL